jgi:hypothetical protein
MAFSSNERFLLFFGLGTEDDLSRRARHDVDSIVVALRIDRDNEEALLGFVVAEGQTP